MSGAVTTVGSRRKPLVRILLLIPALAVAATWALLGSALPETLATHWSGDMYPDGFSSTRPTFTTCLLISIAGAVLGMIGVNLRSAGWRAGLLFVGGMAGWTAASSLLVSAITTASAGDPRQAVLGPWLILLLAGTLFGLAPFWLSGTNKELVQYSEYTRELRLAKAHGRPVPEPLPVPETPFRRNVTAPAWVWLVSVGVLLLVGFVTWRMLPEFQEEGAGMILFSLALMLVTIPLLLGLCLIGVQVDERGLRVSSALLGFPLRKIALKEIESVQTEYINPGQWGGWGWRFFPGGSAVVFKAMDGLTVQTTGGKRFALTMRGSEAVRDQLLARKQTESDT